MKIGFVQFAPDFGQVRRNLDAIERLVCGIKADLLVLPELCTTGYCFASKQEARRLAEPIDGLSIKFLKRLSKERRVSLVAGFAERNGGRIYNSAVLISPDGRLGLYRKTHLFWNEKRWFLPGDTGFRVYDLGTIKVGLMICFDWIFPEAARTLALKGAQVICHPSNLVLPHCPASMPVRALENRVFTVTANRTGRESRIGQELRFIGRSLICGPDRKVLAKAGERGECVKVVEIDPMVAKDKRMTPANDLFRDRRPKFYIVPSIKRGARGV
jgi:predicted amidohydrolase